MARIRSIYIYLAVVLGLLCYLTFIDKKMPGTKEAEEEETELFKFDLDDVTGLEIYNVHGGFIFKKENNHWEIKSPVNTPADGPAVDEILNQIAFAQPQRIIKIDGSRPGDQANLKDWGLTPPAERAVINTPKKNFELLVGRKTAINDSVYARASGRKNESVRILPMTVKDILQKDLSSLRSRSVFDLDIDKVIRISSQTANTATNPAQESEVDLNDGKWTIQKPLVARAADADVQALLAKIIGLRVVDFVTDDASNLTQYGLTSPTATLSLSAKPDLDQVLQIGSPVANKPDELYAHRLKSNSVFTLAKSGLDDLFRAIPNVRDRHVFPFDPAKATEVESSFAGKSSQLRLEKGVWTLVGNGGGHADAGRVNDLLGKLSQLQTTPILKDSANDLKPFGLDKPQGKITVLSPSAKPQASLTLLIGKAENKLLYVRNSAEPFIYTVPDTSFDFLPVTNLALRDGRAINLQLAQIKSLTITPGGSSSVVLTRSEGGTWTASNLKDRMVDSTKVEAQASLLCQLEAAQWLGPVLPAYGLSKPVLTLALQGGDPSPTILRIGSPLPDGGHAAEVEGMPTVFEISDGDFGLLNASSIQLVPASLSATNAPAAQAPVNPPGKK